MNRSDGIQKSPFRTIFIVLPMLLMLLPFVNTVNEFMTRLLLHFEAYRVLEDWVVPYEAKMLAGIFQLFPVNVEAQKEGIFLNGGFLKIEWNCLGWQSVVLLVATLLTGMQGKFTTASRIEAVVVGILGTYLINFARLTIVGALVITFGQTVAVIFHDYFSLLLLVLWFFVFWWFSYSFVLEGRVEQEGSGMVKVDEG